MPGIIITVPDLLRALRQGFDLIQLPVPETAAPSSTPAYHAKKDAVEIMVPSTVARAAITRGLVGHAIKLATGGYLYKLTTRAP